MKTTMTSAARRQIVRPCKPGGGSPSIITELFDDAVLENERVSSVTTGWQISLTCHETVREYYQNFHDANRHQLDSIKVSALGNTVEISAPAGMDIEQAFFLGSTKNPADGDIGGYGEGFKVAALCTLRDYNCRLALSSGTRAVEIKIGDAKIADDLKPLIYCYYRLDPSKAWGGTRLLLEGVGDELQSAFSSAHLDFFYPEHPRLGAKIAGDFDKIYIAKTRDGGPGAMFYLGLNRGKLELPLIIAVNKPYKSLDKLTARDRDRNAFGEPLKRAFYTVVASSGVIRSDDQLAELLATGKEFWEPGHLLFSALLRRTTVCAKSCANLFMDDYFADESHSRCLDAGMLIALKEIEADWTKAGRKRLPHCFRAVGVPSALDAYEEQNRRARHEAEKLLLNQQRGPTSAERAQLDLLEAAVVDLDPVLANTAMKKVQYLIADTKDLLGLWHRTRGYRMREIYLAASLFQGEFSTAFSTHLHELSHHYGSDYSRTFSDKLTDLIEKILHHPNRLHTYARQWITLRAAVDVERSTAPALVDMTQIRRPIGNSGLKRPVKLAIRDFETPVDQSVHNSLDEQRAFVPNKEIADIFKSSMIALKKSYDEHLRQLNCSNGETTAG